MNSLASTLPPEPPECEAAFERMPWMINGSLAPREAQALEAHVARCAGCRARLDGERDLFRAIRRPLDNVEQSPLAAWARFEAALAAAPAQAPAAVTAAASYANFPTMGMFSATGLPSSGAPAKRHHISCATDGFSGPGIAPAAFRARAAARVLR